MRSDGKFRRNLFEIENARNLTRDEVAETFVPTDSFWRLLSAKNHIVLGARGSGKTALAKMLAHDHLARLKDTRAKDAIESRVFLGIYLPTSIEWVGGLKNKPWQTEPEAENFFQWRLNISTCLAFLITLRSCLESYVNDKGKRARSEAQLVESLSDSWSEGTKQFTTIRQLQSYLEDVEHRKQQQMARLRVMGHLRVGEEPVGVSFETSLFSPLRRGITLAARTLDLPEDCTWMLCLDEAEFLEEMHHRVLNSYLRAHSAPLVFKITTMPYCHYTLATNSRAPLAVGHDFEYVYIDQDPILIGSQGETFGDKLFRKRAQNSGKEFSDLSLKKMAGTSALLADKPSLWREDSEEMKLLEKYADPKVIDRARRLLTKPKAFTSQISRKIHGALILKAAVGQQKGREELLVYSGYSMIIRCGDANPRRLIRIFNSLLLEMKHSKKTDTILDGKMQTRVLTAFSTSTLERVESEQGCGPELFKFLNFLGQYMHDDLHENKLRTDQVSSISADLRSSPEEWELIKRAVALGLLFPNISANNPDQMPEREGVFHLAYVLAPHFRLLPRRGKVRRLGPVLDYMREKSAHYSRPKQISLGFGKKGARR